MLFRSNAQTEDTFVDRPRAMRRRATSIAVGVIALTAIGLSTVTDAHADASAPVLRGSLMVGNAGLCLTAHPSSRQLTVERCVDGQESQAWAYDPATLSLSTTVDGTPVCASAQQSTDGA